MPEASIVGAGDVLQILLDGVARTKAELCTLTGLSRGTIAVRIDQLSAANLVKPASAATSSGGRPASRLEFNPAAGHVLALDLGATHASIGVTDLAARVLGSRTMSISIADGPDAVLGIALRAAAELLNGLSLDSPLLGVGVGVPGPVEHSTGRPVSPPIMPGWDAFDIPAYIERELGVVGFVDNDVNILALGEHALEWPDVDDLVFVKVSTGIGSGIIAGGRLQRGAQGSAGDIGHVQVPWNRDSGRLPDDEQDLEAVASGTAVATALRAQGMQTRASSDVVSLVRAGDPAAIAAVRQAGRDVGEVLATIVNLLNPSVIVLGGSLAGTGEHLLAGTREVVYRRSIPQATRELRIVSTRASEKAGVLGAAIMVIQRVLSPTGFDTYVRA